MEVKNGGFHVGIYVLTKSNRRRGVILPFSIWLTLLESIDCINSRIDCARGFGSGTAESITSYGHMVRIGNEWNSLTEQPGASGGASYDQGAGQLFGPAQPEGHFTSSPIVNWFDYGGCNIKSEQSDQSGSDDKKDIALCQWNNPDESSKNARDQTGI